MDSQQAAQDQQAKDFMSSFFPQELSMDPQDHQYQFHQSPNPNSDPHAPMNLNGNMDLIGSIGNLINEQNSSYNPGLLLEQQYKLTQLQQLQQLQNQIFQQQLALLSGGQGPSTLPVEQQPPVRERVVAFHGLPTPGSSTELRAQPSVEFVSPMILDYNDTYTSSHTQSHYSTAPRGSTSAPAHIAFRTTSTQPDLDFDISPLTSPWLGAHQQSVRPPQPSTSSARSSTKRTASSSEDEAGERPSRKKQSPAIRATVPIPKKSNRSKSANSTPLMRSTRARKGSISAPADTPSPVDLSMPPPAPPPDHTFVQAPPPPGGTQMTAATPASIMNLGRLGITSSLSSGGRPPKKSPATVSPGLKAILPGAAASSSRQTNPPPVVRKTSHKAAEQKRRDSLKTTFDDLRGLLPPIPLPSDGADEPVLPGALPPRGPPKAGGEGPNKGVSKLQLLMCGNDYIRTLNARVERRDEEITLLRREVARLRLVVRGEAPAQLTEEEVDLERDLDAVEAYGAGLGHRRMGSIVDDDGEEEED
ncbi:hypothetical protein B0H15DRAFT_944570 [Mycena belliarum]|uniref:BHLH domain-containing protein n=1 Tax=Mycena belliarum TaxID=1033014 RepID=A0AAD6UF67_9AGAR|nr:hypothetical protein B0H15DRAFT_944570 [Mycena belliae]